MRQHQQIIKLLLLLLLLLLLPVLASLGAWLRRRGTTFVTRQKRACVMILISL